MPGCIKNVTSSPWRSWWTISKCKVPLGSPICSWEYKGVNFQKEVLVLRYNFSRHVWIVDGCFYVSISTCACAWKHVLKYTDCHYGQWFLHVYIDKICVLVLILVVVLVRTLPSPVSHSPSVARLTDRVLHCTNLESSPFGLSRVGTLPKLGKASERGVL